MDIDWRLWLFVFSFIVFIGGLLVAAYISAGPSERSRKKHAKHS
jgi:uncharacterized BrkB/YihY/UPF0761 family membrane protein